MLKIFTQQKVLHIVFKSANCVDYIYPHYYSEFKKKKINKLEFLIWDIEAEKILDQMPGIKKIYTIKQLSNFFKFINFFKKKNIILSFFLYILNLIFYKNKKLLNYIQSFDILYFDSKSFKNLVFKKLILNVLNKSNKKIFLVPHGPHYTTSYEEIEYDNFFLNPRVYLLLSNKFSNPWVKNLIKKKQCKYIGFPTSNNVWQENIKKQININSYGFIFRPFIQKKNKKQLKNYDCYINPYDQNIFMLFLAKKLSDQKKKIILRLHPSSRVDDFLDAYSNELRQISYSFSKGSIHDFMNKVSNVVSFHSTALIYAYFYDKKVYLYSNYLEKITYKKWPILKKVYNSFCIKFSNENDFFKKIKLNKKIEKKNFNYFFTTIIFAIILVRIWPNII